MFYAFLGLGSTMTGNDPDGRFMKILANGLACLAPKLDLGSSKMIMLEHGESLRPWVQV